MAYYVNQNGTSKKVLSVAKTEHVHTIDKELSLTSENPLQNKRLGELVGTKKEVFESGWTYSNNPIYSTFNGWIYPLAKSLIKNGIKKVSTILSVDPSPLAVKCIVMDSDKNIVKEVFSTATNQEEVSFNLNIETKDIPTDIFYIGFVSNDEGSSSHLMVANILSGTTSEDYEEIAIQYQNAYTTNKGVSWAWMNNEGSMNFKADYFKIETYEWNELAKKGEVPNCEDVSTNEELGKEMFDNKNLFNIATISPIGQWRNWVNGRIEKYPSNPYIQTYCNSDYIEIESEETYTFTGGNANINYSSHQGICFFNEDKKFLSSVQPADIQGAQTFTTPANTKYCIISFGSLNEARQKVQLEKGNTATPYNPYFGDKYFLNNLFVKKEQIVGENNLIKCADTYDLVVGDSFELFYKGILNVKDYNNYHILCTCDIGKCLTRKFQVSSITNQMVGDHTLSITLYNNEGLQLDTKTITLKVVNKTTSPSSEKVILCMGDSLTQGGQWVDELFRRLTKTTSQTSYGATAPTGLGLSNINFIGKKTSIGGARYEGYGGWTFGSYLSTTSPTMYWLTATANGKTASDQESVWEDTNGVKWQLETIETNRLKFKKYSGSGVMPSSGTLTWVSGGENTEDIIFTASAIAEGNPFVYNGEIDFTAYCEDMGVSTIDEVYILLGWNGATNTPSMTNCKAFIDLLRTFNANIKIVLVGIQVPSLEGCGNNYGASGIYANYKELLNYVFNLDEAYKEVADSYNSNVYSVNLAGQFDTEYNMEFANTTPNARNPLTISMQNNGVHPAITGYYQIADVVYRWFNGHNN